jgi:hypothetical protein
MVVCQVLRLMDVLHEKKIKIKRKGTEIWTSMLGEHDKYKFPKDERREREMETVTGRADIYSRPEILVGVNRELET